MKPCTGARRRVACDSRLSPVERKFADPVKSAIVQQERIELNLLQFRCDLFSVHLTGEKHDSGGGAIKLEIRLPRLVAGLADFQRSGFFVEFAAESLGA